MTGALLDVNLVRWQKRISPEVIYGMVDGGDLIHGRYLWVWNFAVRADGKIRDLRFWKPEVDEQAKHETATLATVIDLILPPSRQNFPSGEVKELLLISWPTLGELRGQLGGLTAGPSFFPRAGLVEFLKRRWLGAGIQVPSSQKSDAVERVPTKAKI